MNRVDKKIRFILKEFGGSVQKNLRMNKTLDYHHKNSFLNASSFRVRASRKKTKKYKQLVRLTSIRNVMSDVKIIINHSSKQQSVLRYESDVTNLLVHYEYLNDFSMFIETVGRKHCHPNIPETSFLRYECLSVVSETPCDILWVITEGKMFVKSSMEFHESFS